MAVAAAMAVSFLLWRPMWAKPIAMQVLDESGQPLSGVHVVALWKLKGGMEGGSVLGVMNVLEAVTDGNGTFSLPGWGPRFPGLLRVLPSMDEYTPVLLFFKPGYRVAIENNRDYTKAGFFVRDFSENGKQVRMEPFTGTMKEYREHLRLWLSSNLEALRNEGSPCAWAKVPKMLRALHAQEQELPSEFFFSGGIFVHNLLVNEGNFVKRGCGSARNIIEGTGHE